jgi:hypothetical protein
MDPNLILQIIKLSLELALQIAKDMPAEQKAKFWADHAARQAFWENLIKKLTPQ